MQKRIAILSLLAITLLIMTTGNAQDRLTGGKEFKPSVEPAAKKAKLIIHTLHRTERNAPTLIITPSNHVILIDPGRPAFLEEDFSLEDLLDKYNIKKIDSIFLTFDYDQKYFHALFDLIKSRKYKLGALYINKEDMDIASWGLEQKYKKFPDGTYYFGDTPFVFNYGDGVSLTVECADGYWYGKKLNASHEDNKCMLLTLNYKNFDLAYFSYLPFKKLAGDDFVLRKTINKIDEIDVVLSHRNIVGERYPLQVLRLPDTRLFYGFADVNPDGLGRLEDDVYSMLKQFNASNSSFLVGYEDSDFSIRTDGNKFYYLTDSNGRQKFTVNEKLPANYRIPRFNATVKRKDELKNFLKYDVNINDLSVNNHIHRNEITRDLGEKPLRRKKLSFLADYSPVYSLFETNQVNSLVRSYDRFGFFRTKLFKLDLDCNFKTQVNSSTTAPREWSDYYLDIFVKTPSGLPVEGARVSASITYHIYRDSASGTTDKNGYVRLKINTATSLGVGTKYKGTVNVWYAGNHRGTDSWWVRPTH